MSQTVTNMAEAAGESIIKRRRNPKNMAESNNKLCVIKNTLKDYNTQTSPTNKAGDFQTNRNPKTSIVSMSLQDMRVKLTTEERNRQAFENLDMQVS